MWKEPSDGPFWPGSSSHLHPNMGSLNFPEILESRQSVEMFRAKVTDQNNIWGCDMKVHKDPEVLLDHKQKLGTKKCALYPEVPCLHPPSEVILLYLSCWQPKTHSFAFHPWMSSHSAVQTCSGWNCSSPPIHRLKLSPKGCVWVWRLFKNQSC